MENLTPSKMMALDDFILNIDTCEYIVDLTSCENLGTNLPIGDSTQIGFLEAYCTVLIFLLHLAYRSNR